MYFQTLRLAIIAAAITIVTPAFAQDCGCGGGSSYGGGYGYGGGQLGGDVGQLGFGFHSPSDCGRAITQQQAEGLWAGYCNDNCGYAGGGSAGVGGRGGGCKLLGGCKGGGLGGGGCGCNSGCFGYPAGGGCGGGGCKLGGRHGGGCGKRKGLHGGGCGGGSCGGGGGCDSCGGESYGGGGGGCGCGKQKGLHGGGCGGGCKLFGGCKKFSGSAQQCGTSGAYFTEAVGHEYGTAGIQSCVSCNSCGSFDSLAPMSAPIAQPHSFIGSGVMAPVGADPIVGAIGALN